MDKGGKRDGWADTLAEGRLPRFILICLGVWMNAADTLVTATIMPSVGAELNSYRYFSWAVAGFLVGAIVAGASAGRFAEVAGLRNATVLSGLTFAIGCALGALAPDISVFLVGRFIQGIGSGWISGLAMVAIAFVFPDRHLTRIFGAVAGVWGVATVLGPLMGGVAAELNAWRLLFWFFAAQALLFALAAWCLLAGDIMSSRARKVPWLQLAILLISILTLGIADMAQSVPFAVGCAIAGIALLALMLRIDARAPAHLFPRHIANLATADGLGYAALFWLMAASSAFLIYGPPFLQRLYGMSPLTAGYIIGAYAMSWTVAALMIGSASGGRTKMFIRVGSLCILAGPVLLCITMPNGPLPLVILSGMTMGSGYGLTTALFNRRVLGSLSDDERAIGSAALITVRQIGQAMSAAIVGAVANFAGFADKAGMMVARSASFWVYAVSIPIAICGVIAAWRLTQMNVREDFTRTSVEAG